MRYVTNITVFYAAATGKVMLSFVGLCVVVGAAHAMPYMTLASESVEGRRVVDSEFSLLQITRMKLTTEKKRGSASQVNSEQGTVNGEK